MAETLTQPTGLLVLGAGGRLTCSVPVGPVFAPRSFAKTSNERAGKAPVVRDDGTRLGTVAAITETADAFTFEVDADDAGGLDGLEATLRFRPITETAGTFTEVAVWELTVPAPGPSLSLRRRQAWLAAHNTEATTNE